MSNKIKITSAWPCTIDSHDQTIVRLSAFNNGIAIKTDKLGTVHSVTQAREIAAYLIQLADFIESKGSENDSTGNY